MVRKRGSFLWPSALACKRSLCTGRRGGHTPFVQAGAEASDTDAQAVKQDSCSWEGHTERMCVGVGDVSADLVRLSNHTAFHW